MSNIVTNTLYFFEKEMKWVGGKGIHGKEGGGRLKVVTQER